MTNQAFQETSSHVCLTGQYDWHRPDWQYLWTNIVMTILGYHIFLLNKYPKRDTTLIFSVKMFHHHMSWNMFIITGPRYQLNYCFTMICSGTIYRHNIFLLKPDCNWHILPEFTRHLKILQYLMEFFCIKNSQALAMYVLLASMTGTVTQTRLAIFINKYSNDFW